MGGVAFSPRIPWPGEPDHPARPMMDAVAISSSSSASETLPDTA